MSNIQIATAVISNSLNVSQNSDLMEFCGAAELLWPTKLLLQM